MLRLLLELNHPDDVTRRSAAAGELGRGGDARAPGPLRLALRREELAVRLAAARALAHHRGAAVEAALDAVLRAAGSPLELRVAAAESLGAQATTSAAGLLWNARGKETTELGQAVRAVLAARYPELYAHWLAELPDEADPAGRGLLMLTMAAHGGYFMTAMADIADGDPGVLSALGGAAIGGVAPLLLTLDDPPSVKDAMWISSTTTWALVSSLLTGSAAGLEDDGLLWLSIGGQGAGLAAGLLTADALPHDHGDILYAHVASFAGVASAGGALLLYPGAGGALSAGIVQLGLTAGVTGGLLAAPQLELDGGDRMLIAQAMFGSAWVGLWAPSILLGEETGARHRAAGALFGASAGFVGASLLSQQVQLDGDDVWAPLFGALYGSSVGGGTALLLHDDLGERPQAALLISGGVLGAFAAGVADDGRPTTGGQDALIGVGSGWGLWHGIGLAIVADADAREGIGAALLGTGVGGLISAASARAIDPTATQVGIAAAGGAWGGWLAGWTAHVVGKGVRTVDGDDVLLATLVGSDAGLALAATLLSPALDVPEARLGWINLSGLIGLGLGTSLTTAFDRNHVAEGNVVGTSLGLIGGAIATAQFDFKREPAGQLRASAAPRGAHRFSLRPGVAFLPDRDGRPAPVLTLSGSL